MSDHLSRHLGFERALLDPASSFDTRQDVVRSSELSWAQNIEVLCRWAYDARELAVAEEEGMNGGETPNNLDAVVAALNNLVGGVDEEHTPPTQHAAFCVASRTAQSFNRATLRAIVLLGAAAGAMVLAQPAHASAFAIQEQSASALGRAFAGTASTPDDPSILYYNPAAITAFRHLSVSAGVSLLDLSTTFQNTGSQPAFGQPLGNSGGNAGSWNAVPNVEIVAPLTDAVSLGLAVNVPFGLKTEYASDWLGRYQGVYSELKATNFNLSAAWRATDRLSLGAGANYQHVQSTLTSAVNYSALIAGGIGQLAAAGQIPPSSVPGLLAANAGLSGNSTVSGTGDGWGFNVGALYSFNDNVRLGLAYRSEIKATIRGSASFTAPVISDPVGAAIAAAAAAPGGLLANGAVSLPLTLPASATASLDVALSPRSRLLLDVQYTQWSVFLTINRSAGGMLSSVPEDYRNTWREAIGTEYALSPKWMLRCGAAYRGHSKRSCITGESEEILEANWVAAEMGAGGAYAYAILALDTIDEATGKQGV
jgi:long-chain fatty acid transport protein